MNLHFQSKMEIPRTKDGKQQEIETLIAEETYPFTKYSGKKRRKNLELFVFRIRVLENQAWSGESKHSHLRLFTRFNDPSREVQDECLRERMPKIGCGFETCAVAW